MISYLQNSSGELSSGRLLMMITNLVILAVWAFATYMSVKSGGGIPPIPTEALTLGGFTIMGKVINSALSEKGMSSNDARQ
jgi:hypothetical protein